MEEIKIEAPFFLMSEIRCIVYQKRNLRNKKKSPAANKVYSRQCPYSYKKKDFNSRNQNKQECSKPSAGRWKPKKNDEA